LPVGIAANSEDSDSTKATALHIVPDKASAASILTAAESAD